MRGACSVPIKVLAHILAHSPFCADVISHPYVLKCCTVCFCVDLV